MPAFRRQNPMNELPVELLSEIFDLCVLATVEPGPNSDDSNAPLNINTDTIRVPLILSSVSRRWREVALGQASLWANICITEELFSRPYDVIDATHITTYLARSRNHPLTILIDSRDPDWDFTEADVGFQIEMATCSVLFTPNHMSRVIALLLPQLPRWKALTIYTDTWAPMHAALKTMSPSVTLFGAPLLTSLILMRCNDFVSFSPRFQPVYLRDTGFLSRRSEETTNMLPSLKHLVLAGVHVDWDTLSDALASSPNGLTFLQLSSHATDVRPTIEQFHKLLKANPKLRELCLCGSGPQDIEAEGERPVIPNCDPVQLPHLQDITLGYRTEHEGETIFRMLDAPNIKTLVLEDATYPADPIEINAGSMLVYLGTKESPDNVSLHKAGYAPPQAEGKPHPKHICSHRHIKHLEQRTPCAAFPRLQRLTMKNVKALHYPLRTFFNAHPHLQHIELDGMTVLPLYALIPGVGRSVSPTESSCPCPRLRSLRLKGTEHLAMHDLDFVVHQLGDLREARGALSLARVDTHVDGAVRAMALRRSAECASSRTRFAVVDESADGDEREDVDIGDEEEDGVRSEEKRETTSPCWYHTRSNEAGLPCLPAPYLVSQQPITAH